MEDHAERRESTSPEGAFRRGINNTSVAAQDFPLSTLRVALELVIPSDLRYIGRVVDLVAWQCKELEYHPRQIALNIPVAVTEALSNAILRGNSHDPAKHVRIRSEADSQLLVVEIRDEGSGFDLARCAVDPTTPQNILREDGRGLYLMGCLMDRIERFSNEGNVVRMELRRYD